MNVDSFGFFVRKINFLVLLTSRNLSDQKSYLCFFISYKYNVPKKYNLYFFSYVSVLYVFYQGRKIDSMKTRNELILYFS